MNRLIALISLCTVLGVWQAAIAAGTPANTAIATQATAEYQVGAATLTQTSNIVTATVAEVLDVHMTWQDGTAVSTHPVDTDQVLTFRITNTGNGMESFTLAGSGAVSGDDFDPLITAIYLDSNGNALFDAGTDTLYSAGTNDPALAPDAALTLFALGTIPNNLNDGDSGDCRITVTALTGTGSPGASLGSMGDGGTEAIIGASGASADAIGSYTISDARLAVIKSATVVDPRGGNLPTTDAVITYQVQVQVTGSGTAHSVVFSDPIPADTTYRPHSLQLNGTPLSDALDSDAGDINATAANSITVSLGDLADTSPTQTITFDVRID